MQEEAVAAHDDQRLLDGVDAAIHHIVQHALDRAALLLHALADGAQFRRGFFAQLAVAG